MLNENMEYDKINGKNNIQYINLNKVCGIYCIYNEEYFYVGQSNNIRSRWNSHRSKLKRENMIIILCSKFMIKELKKTPFNIK